MKRKPLFLFICICAALSVQTVLVLFLHEVPGSCRCDKKQPLHSGIVRIVSSKIHASEKVIHIETSRNVPRNIVDFSSEMYLEPLVKDEFPTVSSVEPRIPHIIHQTYKTQRIPVVFEQHVRTIVEKNPNWTYYFWTDESSRRFVYERYPKLLQMWDSYKSPINRADAIRYLVLYEYGGIYADLDVECMRPLHNSTTKYACIFPLEPFEQSVFRIHLPYLLSNAIMLCRPKHPFLKQIVDTLHQYRPMLEQIDVAGPSFVTSEFIRYNNITADYVYKLKQSNESNSPYFYKGELAEGDNDAVYVPNTQYFINSLSQTWMNEKDYKKICAKSGTKTILVQKACNELTRRLSQENRDRYAFTDHHWVTSYNHPRSKLLRTYQSLDKIVNKYTIY